jgi:hypothetical protein
MRSTFLPDLRPGFVRTRCAGVVVFGLMVCAALAGAAWGLVESTKLVRSKPAQDALWATGVEAHVPDSYEVDPSPGAGEGATPPQESAG